MPLITTPLKRNDTGPAVAELQTALLKLGAPIADAEKTAKRVGDSTLAAVLELRKRYQLPDVPANAPPFDASLARLLHVEVTALDGNRVALRTAVRESVAAAGNATPQENSALARFAVIAGDYPTAQLAATRAPQLSDLVTQIFEANLDLSKQPPRPPEVPYPENFYTYYYRLVPQETLDQLLDRTVTGQSGSSARMIARRAIGRDGEGDWPDLPDEPDTDPPPSNPTTDPARQTALKKSADSWLRAVDNWQFGNEEFRSKRYASAVSAYTACQKATLSYFGTYYGPFEFFRGTLEQLLDRLVVNLASRETQWSFMWQAINRRRFMLSLEELGTYDWSTVTGSALELLEVNLDGAEVTNPDSFKPLRQRSLDRPLLILASVFAPLARAEANRLRRQYDAAERDLRRVLRPYQVRTGSTPPTTRPVWLTCDFIEIPFARLLLAETLLDKADAQYKARVPVAIEDVATREALQTAAVEYRNRLGDPGDRNQTSPFQLQLAASSYLNVFELFRDEGQYTSRVTQGLATLNTELNETAGQGDVKSKRFQTIGKRMTIPTVKPVGGPLVEIDRHVGPHEPLLRFQPPSGQTVMREINPRVYSVLLEAQARLVQLWSWFNYLGYSDEYVPAWRFQFLLERARYFAEHAKNAQRDYLNFLNNAEHEEFQELSASQNLELEKSNVQIETARVDQVRLEVFTAGQSFVLANMVAENAQTRLDDYKSFDEYADRIMDIASLGNVSMGFELLGEFLPGAGTVIEGIGDFFTGGFFSSSKRKLVEARQRELEKKNLSLAVHEARQARNVAGAQLKVAEAGLLVAGLQRQAALLRHEFAVQNLNFLRNRILNAEQWYRLGGAIRSVSETYLRYAIEVAFLAEQAYEFEADKSINVIRFDYDQSEVGDFLAADFLLRDLDTLEQDLIVNQRQRQQQVRYVVSMSREFPAALQELRDNGLTTFSLPLEQLERRFPGLYNLRIGAVDLLPIALMDSTRFSLGLTYQGSSTVRLPAPAGSDDPWTTPLIIRGPDTTIFSGLSRQEASAVFAFATSGQRNAFEGLGAASAWQIDMSMKDNQVVPETLSDFLLTFTLSGYYDSDLRTIVEQQQRAAEVETSWLSARQTFPDAFYDFNRTGRMEWTVSRDLLTLTDSIGALRNVGVMLIPTPGKTDFGRLMNHYLINFEITNAGDLKLLSEVPQLKFEPIAPADSLKLKAKATVPAGATLSWNFGDGEPLQSGATPQHTYEKPGKYEVTLRIIRDGRLSEFKSEVVVSRNHRPTLPVTAFPILSRDPDVTGLSAGHTRIAAAATTQGSDPVTGIWSLSGAPSRRGDRVTFDLRPGAYSLTFRAIRTLKARAYCSQRFSPNPVFAVPSLTLSSNRTFDLNGQETTGVSPNAPANSFTQRLFTAGALSPLDDWVLELPLAENPQLKSVDFSDTEMIDLADVQDAILVLEYGTN